MRTLTTLIFAIVLSASASADPTQESKRVDCYCTDATGGRVELGESVCLFVNGRHFVALCDMSLNNPAWRDTGVDCVLSNRMQIDRGSDIEFIV